MQTGGEFILRRRDNRTRCNENTTESRRLILGIMAKSNIHEFSIQIHSFETNEVGFELDL